MHSMEGCKHPSYQLKINFLETGRLLRHPLPPLLSALLQKQPRGDCRISPRCRNGKGVGQRRRWGDAAAFISRAPSSTAAGSAGEQAGWKGGAHTTTGTGGCKIWDSWGRDNRLPGSCPPRGSSLGRGHGAPHVPLWVSPSLSIPMGIHPPAPSRGDVLGWKQEISPLSIRSLHGQLEGAGMGPGVAWSPPDGIPEPPASPPRPPPSRRGAARRCSPCEVERSLL